MAPILLPPFGLTRRTVLVAGPAACMVPAAWAAANEVQGQGASFPSKVYALWARQFAEARGIKVSYKATGSGDGVADTVRATPGAIGYVSFDRAGAAGLAAVMLRNLDGHFVPASEAAFRSAIMHSDLFRREQDMASLVEQSGPQTWPITMTSFVLIDAQPAAAAAVEPTLRFLYWCLMRGDDLTRGTGFAALPQARFAGRFVQVVPPDGVRPEYQAF